MRSYHITALIFVLLITVPFLSYSQIRDTWVGGVELPNRYLFLLAHFETSAADTAGTLYFADGEKASIEFEGRTPEELRFSLTADGTVYVFSGRIMEGNLTGIFFPQGNESSSFPFRFVPIHRMTIESLQGLEGTYDFEDGSSWKIRAVTPGFLRAYDLKAGLFHNLYPETDSRFFQGSDLGKPLPREAEVEFSTDGVRHTTRGRGQRVDELSAELSWSEEGKYASVGLPDGKVLHLLRVEPGTFGMGAPVDALAAESMFGFDEGTIKVIEYPQRQTELTKSYWLGRSEVTNAQFRTFVDEDAYITRAEMEGSGLLWIDGAFKRVDGASWRRPGREIRPNEPVVMLSWHDANAFCQWLSRRTGREFRLPSEAEWEYASRAGRNGFYGFGSDPLRLEEFAWFGENSGGMPHEVESRKPNDWGFYDMHGNVWEWCSDWYATFDRSGSATDPVGPDAGKERVLRGGSWINGAFDCRSGYRAHDDPELAEPHFGFRVSASVDTRTGK